MCSDLSDRRGERDGRGIGGLWARWGEGVWITGVSLGVIALNLTMPPGRMDARVLTNWLLPHVLLWYWARHPVREYGLDFRDVKGQVRWTGYAYGLLLPVIIVFAQRGEFRRFYGFAEPDGAAFLYKELVEYGVRFAVWEFLLRAFLLHGLARHFGWWAVILEEVIIFPLAHIGKPGLEMAASAYAGLVFSVASYRSRSFLPAFLSHWGLAVTLDTIVFVGKWGWAPILKVVGG